MKKAIIFDFNRTLYDPQSGKLISDAQEILEHFYGKKYPLALISRIEPGREGVLDALCIKEFFMEVNFVSQKTKEVFESIAGRLGAPASETYVVGDYLYDEIRIGNLCGMRTIHFTRGTFAGLLPKSAHDKPWRAISTLSELKELID